MADTAAADKKQDGAEEEALQAKAFEALERDFQEVSTRAWKLRRAEKALPCSRPQEAGSGGERKASERAWAQAHGLVLLAGGLPQGPCAIPGDRGRL